jgi:16S rRNA processing protein RimM
MALRFIGSIVNTKGLNGTLVLRKVPKDLQSLTKEINVKIGFSDSFAMNYTMTKFKMGNDFALCNLKEIINPEDAIKLKEKGIFAEDKDLIKDGKETYFVDELVGAEVFDWKNKKKLGEISDVWVLPANDVWLMKTEDGKEIPLPVIDDVIKKVKVEDKVIFINLINGLAELADDNLSEDDIDE